MESFATEPAEGGKEPEEGAREEPEVVYRRERGETGGGVVREPAAPSYAGRPRRAEKPWLTTGSGGANVRPLARSPHPEPIMPTPLKSVPLGEFQRDPGEHAARLKRTGLPELLTVDGRAELVVMDAEAYRRLLERLDRAETLVALREGLDSIERGEKGMTLEEVMRSLREVDGEEDDG